MISSENGIGQIEKSSPAQIRDEGCELATIIFGSNFLAAEWTAKYVAMNEMGSSIDSCGDHCPGSHDYTLATHQHTKTHNTKPLSGSLKCGTGLF